MTKLTNRPDQAVAEMVDGLLALHPGMGRLAGYPVVVSTETLRDRDRAVAVLSGGGSGHEPAHAGYVGPGMLSGAICGEVFTSPSVDAVLAAVRAVAGRAGVLLIIKNYTGDRLNFGLAAELARAEGISVETVFVADDVALRAQEGPDASRGIAGTVLVHKLAGAAAAEGKTLAEVAQIARRAAADLGTIGVAWSACTMPGAARPNFDLPPGEMELGLGIHGEAGLRRVPLEPADRVVEALVEAIWGALAPADGQRVAVLLNNLGGTTSLELTIAARRTLQLLQTRRLEVERFYCGTFLSSLDMAGISLTVLPVDDERLRLLDADTLAPAWPRSIAHRPGDPGRRVVAATQTGSAQRRPAAGEPDTELGRRMGRAIRQAAQFLIDASSRLTDLDRLTGDGDLGISLERGARAALAEMPDYALDQPADGLAALGRTLQRAVGGTSGPLYGILFVRAAACLGRTAADTPESWVAALGEGVAAVAEMGGARTGDRTMVDALIPFAGTLAREMKDGHTPVHAFRAAREAAEAGAEATSRMRPRLGRSRYLGERVLGHPDPGAVAVTIWLAAIQTALIPGPPVPRDGSRLPGDRSPCRWPA